MKIATSLRSLSGLVLTAALAAAGCGGGDDSPCVEATTALCAAACDCGGADGCAIGDDSGALTFDDEAGCRAFLMLGCSQDDGSVDFDACKSALANPMCVQSTDGQALDPPDSCEAVE